MLGAPPKSTHRSPKKALAEISGAEDKYHALAAVKQFQALFGAKFGKTVAKITDDVAELLAFYDYPAEHLVHLRTTNPIESTFATVRHRTKITRGHGSKAAGLATGLQAHPRRTRALARGERTPLVTLVRAGATRGKLVERDEDQPPVTPSIETAA